jgi:hypothetical protein
VRPPPAACLVPLPPANLASSGAKELVRRTLKVVLWPLRVRCISGLRLAKA